MENTLILHDRKYTLIAENEHDLFASNTVYKMMHHSYHVSDILTALA